MNPVPTIDPAAQFAIAQALWNACHDHAAKTKDVNLSDIFNGMDEFMRVVMRIGERFERWACEHVNFDEFDDVWPYLLQAKFGTNCLESVALEELPEFNEEDCLRMALQMNLPVNASKGLPVPIHIEAANPVTGSAFKAFLIRTVRRTLNDDAVEAFVSGDDPYDENFEEHFYSLYGIDEEGKSECIADRSSYESTRDLALKLAPGINFPERISSTINPY